MSKTDRKPLVVLPLVAVTVMAATPASANMPMLPFFAFVRMSMWWVILLALLIETVAIRYLFSLEWVRAARAAVIVNAISLLCGSVLYPLAGVFGYALLEDMIVDLFGATDFVEMSSLWMGAAVVDAVVELFLLRWLFSLKISYIKGFSFLLANLASSGVLVAVMAWETHIPNMSAEEAAWVEAEYAKEIAFLRGKLEEFPAHMTAITRREGAHPPDSDWTQAILTELGALRIRTMALSLPPTTVWIKGSTALLEVEKRLKEGDHVVDKGLVDQILIGQRFRPTGSTHYRYRIDLTVDGTSYAIEAIFKN